MKFKGVNKKYISHLNHENFLDSLKLENKFDLIKVESCFLINKKELEIYYKTGDFNPTFRSKKYKKVYVDGKFEYTKPIILNLKNIDKNK